MNINEAIAAVKDNPPHRLSPLPWWQQTPPDDRTATVSAGNCSFAADCSTDEDATHIAAAVNAAPVLVAEVERLQAELTVGRTGEDVRHAQMFAWLGEMAKKHGFPRSLAEGDNAFEKIFDHFGLLQRDSDWIGGVMDARNSLRARVSELEAQLSNQSAEAQALGHVHIACGEAGIPPGNVVARVRALTARLDAVRVAVGKWKPVSHNVDCPTYPGWRNTRCTCGTAESNAARSEARRALGLEGDK